MSHLRCPLSVLRCPVITILIIEFISHINTLTRKCSINSIPLSLTARSFTFAWGRTYNNQQESSGTRWEPPITSDHEHRRVDLTQNSNLSWRRTAESTNLWEEMHPHSTERKSSWCTRSRKLQTHGSERRLILYWRYIFDASEEHIPPLLVPECFHVFCTTDHLTMNTVRCKTVTQWTLGAVGRLQNGRYVNDEAWINPEINLLHFEMFIWFQPYNIISSLIIDDIKSSYRFRYSPST